MVVRIPLFSTVVVFVFTTLGFRYVMIYQLMINSEEMKPSKPQITHAFVGGTGSKLHAPGFTIQAQCSRFQAPRFQSSRFQDPSSKFQVQAPDSRPHDSCTVHPGGKSENLFNFLVKKFVCLFVRLGGRRNT